LSERANIFGRIREALRVSAPPPGSRHHEKSAQFVSEAEAAKHISEWLPAVGDSFEERVEMFRANALELKAEFQLLGGLSEMKPAFVSSQKGRAGKESPAIPANSLIGHEPLWHSRGWSRTTAMTLKSLKNATPVSASATRLSPRLAACSSPQEAAEDGLFRCCLPIIWSWRAGTSFSQICRRRSRSSKQNTVQTIRVLSPLSRAQAGPVTSSVSWYSAHMGRES
jgi:hypothetical protein